MESQLNTTVHGARCKKNQPLNNFEEEVQLKKILQMKLSHLATNFDRLKFGFALRALRWQKKQQHDGKH